MVVDNFKEMLEELPRMAVEEKECIEQEGHWTSLEKDGEVCCKVHSMMSGVLFILFVRFVHVNNMLLLFYYFL